MVTQLAPSNLALFRIKDNKPSAFHWRPLVPGILTEPLLSKNRISANNTVGQTQCVSDPHIVQQKLNRTGASIHATLNASFALQETCIDTSSSIKHLTIPHDGDSMQA